MRKYYCLIVLFFFLFQNSMGKRTFNNIGNNKKQKEILILQKALGLILKENADYICLHKKLTEGKCPLSIRANKVVGSKGVICYTIYFSNTGLSDSDLPSKLININGVYCVIYNNEICTISRYKIPFTLFSDCDDGISNEDSWMVLICKNNFRYLVVNNGSVPYKAIKQFQNFSCEQKKTRSTQSKIEKGIVDYLMMDSIIKRAP